MILKKAKEMSSIFKTRGKRMDTKKGGSKQARKWPEIKGIEKKRV